MSLSQDGIKLAHVPFVYELFKTNIYLDLLFRATSAKQRPDKAPQQTVVTPQVHSLSLTMFQQHFKMVKPLKQGVLKSYHHSLSFGEIHGTSLTMKWIGVPSIYNAVRIGKMIYQVLAFLFSLMVDINYLSLVILLLCFLVKIQTKCVKGMHKL